MSANNITQPALSPMSNISLFPIDLFERLFKEEWTSYCSLPSMPSWNFRLRSRTFSIVATSASRPRRRGLIYQLTSSMKGKETYRHFLLV